MIVLPCLLTDINKHYKVIKEKVSDSDETLFKFGMHECVKAGTAYYVDGTDCFLYYLNKTYTIANGIAFNGHSNPTITLSMLCSIFTGKGTCYVDFYPHEDTSSGIYRSLIAGSKAKGTFRVDVGRILRVVKDKTTLKVPHV